jgi:hypothetical protein
MLYPNKLTGWIAALIAATGASLTAQAPRATSSFIAFRADDQHVVAVMAEVSDQPDTIDGAPPAARFGFEYRDADPAIVAAVPREVFTVKRWTVHLGPGRRVAASAGRIVHGGAACTGLAGMVLQIDPQDQQAYAVRPEKYFVVDAADGGKAAASAPPSRTLPPIDRTQLESVLNGMLKRELPGVRAEAAEEIARLAAGEPGYQRNWAIERRELDSALDAGKARLEYDVQAFALERNGPPRYFVRAEWAVGGRAAFGAALWVKGGDTLSIVDQDLSTARWLRMFEFQGKVSPELYGLVLNVFDRDGDGWSEVLMARGGYESNKLELIALTPGGFVPTGISYSYGC